MSYPSVTRTLARQGVTVETATQEQMERALIEAYEIDLSLGMDYLACLARQVQTDGQRRLQVEDPNSPLGRQLIRLLGTDVSRPLVERHLDIAFGLYNCCNVVAALTRPKLAMNAAEQIKLQNGALAHADC